MSSSHPDQIETLKEQLENLIDDYRVVNKQLSNDLIEVNRNRLRRQSESLEQEIKQVESKLDLLQTKQAPVLSQGEDDFAIDLHPLPKRQSPMMKQKTAQIEDPKDLLPTPKAETTAILSDMFAGYERVIVETQFGGGFSGSYVFKVKPIKARAASKSVVVKIASLGQSKQEQHGYLIIRDYWSQLMRVEEQLIMSPDGRWAGLCYQMAGGDLFKVSTLLDFVHHHDLDEISEILHKQLIPVMEQAYRNTLDAEMQAYWNPSYTHLLPKNLVISAAPIPSTEPTILINADHLPTESPQTDEYVQLNDFEVEKINLTRQRLSLTLRAKNRWQAYTVWVNGVSTLDDYKTGEIAPTITGRVIKNRNGCLYEEASKVLGANVDLNQPTLIVTDKLELPNPLQQLDQILAIHSSMRIAHLHGDLNLANILVTDTQQIQFIDFAAARKDHVFHDYFRLETGIMTKVVPQLLYQAKHSPHPEQVAATICLFYRQLHQAITHPTQSKTSRPYPELAKPFEILRLLRQSARHFLVQADDWMEYYYGLTIYLLGTLRFADLEEIEGVMTPLPKQVAFWGAGTIVEIIKNPQNDDLIKVEEMQPKNQAPLAKDSNNSHNAPHRDNGSSMSTSSPPDDPIFAFQQIKVKTLKKNLADLIANYEAANNQLRHTLSDVDSNKLKSQVETLEQKITQVNHELNTLQ